MLSLILFLFLAGAACALSPHLSLTAPQGSSPLSPTFLSFSIEQDRWPGWAGVTSRNSFVYNALTNLGNITGQPPKIRVGANSQDRTKWNASIDVMKASFPSSSKQTPYPETSNMTVGDHFYKLSKWMPRGTHMTWGINLAADNSQIAVDVAKSIMRAFNNGNQIDNTGIYLDILELGNEPDLFAGKSRPSGWTASQYVADWEKIASPIISALNLSPNGPVTFQVLSCASQRFTARDAFSAGMHMSKPGQLISTISQHRYSAYYCSGGSFQLKSFMSKTAVRSNLSIFDADISATKAKGLTYILGETNNIACHGAPGVSNTAGAALWAIDFSFQAATHGIAEVYFHHGIGYKYNFLQPITLDRSPVDGSSLQPPLLPHAQPGYYAGIIIAEGIGANAGSGKTEIIEIALSASNLSGYSIYENGSLVRAVFINLDAWLSTDQGTRQRQTTHIDLSSLGSGSNTVTVKRLQINFADDTNGLTWNGQTYETSDILVSGTPNNEQVTVGQGFDIAESEAVMILF